MGIGFAAVIPKDVEREAIRITGGKIVGEIVGKDKGIKVGDMKIL